MGKRPYCIWLVEGKTPLLNTWEPVFTFGKSNEDIPRIVWSRYRTKKQAKIAAAFMQKTNDANTDPKYPWVVYRAAKYQRVSPND